VIAVALCLFVGAAVPQDPGMLDVPVYRDEAFGIALPRPFPDWVFSSGSSRGTSTVIFHPRDLPLGEQLWGALVLTSFDEPVHLAELAERRVQETWRPSLGRTFRVLARDSLAVARLPAYHIVVTGAVDRVAVDVEEYFVARGPDLVILQFRYPHGSSRDSLAEGYRRVVDGLTVRAPLGEEAPLPAAALLTPPDAEQAAAAERALSGSPWRLRSCDAVVRFDPEAVRTDISVRLEIANVDARAHDSLALGLPWTLLLDGVRSATGEPLALRTDGDVAWVRLPQDVAPLASGAVSVAMHAPAGTSIPPLVAMTTDGAHLLDNWLPRVESSADSAGAPRVPSRPGCTLRFDLPPEFTAIAAGRLAADFVSEGRRRTTWSAGRGSAPAPEFVIGRFRRVAVREGPLVTLRAWVAAADSSAAPSRADTIAGVAMEAWRFFTAAFGRLAIEDAYLLVADLERQGTAGATLLLPANASDDSVRTAVARVWWGSAVRFVGAGAQWLADALPSWSVLLYHESTDSDSTQWRAFRAAAGANGPVAALETIRSTIGDAAFRAALRRFFLEHRFVPAAQADLNALFEQVSH
jgi:hypothetical protein